MNRELVVDNFAGGGGASTGIELSLGHSVDIAINHDQDAIDMHSLNHPTAKHYCESVWDVDPVEATKGKPVGLGWFSPDCKHFSRANGSSQRNMPCNEPLRTLCSSVKGGHFALVTSHMVKFRGTNVGHGTDEPVHTISSGGNHIGEVRAFLVKYYGNSGAVSIANPLDTVTTKDRFGLVTVQGTQYQITDIGMRMLEPHELFAAMGFPLSYKIGFDPKGKKLSKAKQIARCGNAVCPPIAKALVDANVKLRNI